LPSKTGAGVSVDDPISGAGVSEAGSGMFVDKDAGISVGVVTATGNPHARVTTSNTDRYKKFLLIVKSPQYFAVYGLRKNKPKSQS
jgi:hypothetical protein